MKPSEQVLDVLRLFQQMHMTEFELGALAEDVVAMEQALVSAYDDSGVCPLCGEHDHRRNPDVERDPCVMTRLCREPSP